MSRVLVVDDDIAILQAIEMVLESFQYEVMTLSDPKNAYPLAKKHTPDVIILDILMSGEDGRDIAVKLKKDESTKKIPIIMISAHPSIEEKALESGADTFLAKPFDVEDLVSTVASMK